MPTWLAGLLNLAWFLALSTSIAVVLYVVRIMRDGER